MPRRDLLIAGLSIGLGITRTSRGSEYALDDLSRRVPDERIVPCPKVAFVRYPGTLFRYSPTAVVYRDFVERLSRFEALALEVGRQFYGRGPQTLLHIGTRLCRRMRKDRRYFSEHAFGNAIDVVGFDFAGLAKHEVLPKDTPTVFRNYCSVRVGSHWRPQPGVANLHSRFLRALLHRLVAERGIFRVLLGPAHPGHSQHFHFDCGPERLVDVF